ncbi:MAG: hypothetical protein EBZ56_07385, partial [Burkholderiaceae bacterium]|nr:hypothetical protein [Burkholderiaceae bacterium]
LKQQGVVLTWLTLHVGAGTFQPVRTENLSDHQMHSEWYSLPQSTVDVIQTAQRAGRNVIAVGTTSLRALEAASQTGKLLAGNADTRLFITPGYRFNTVNRLRTGCVLSWSYLQQSVLSGRACWECVSRPVIGLTTAGRLINRLN